MKQLSTWVLIALVAVNAALMGLIVKDWREGPQESQPAAPQSPAAQPAKPTSAAPAPATDRMVLVPVDSERGYRLQSGPCGGKAPVVEETRDGGGTWSALAKPPAATGTWLNGSGAGVQLTGGSATCAPASWTSGGEGWEQADPTGWRVEPGPKKTDIVKSPSQKAVTVCGGRVDDLAAAGETAYVLCPTGVVESVRSDGKHNKLTTVKGAHAIATVSGDSPVVVLRTTPECALEVARVEKSTFTDTSCLRKTGAPGKAPADVSFSGSDGWAAVGKDVWRGELGGSTWERPSPEATQEQQGEEVPQEQQGEEVPQEQQGEEVPQEQQGEPTS